MSQTNLLDPARSEEVEPFDEATGPLPTTPAPSPSVSRRFSLPQLSGSGVLTNSRQSTFRQCRRKHYYRYTIGVRTSSEAGYFRFGRAFHLGLELRGKGHETGVAIVAAGSVYEELFSAAKTEEWLRDLRYEQATVQTLLALYFWYWERDDVPPHIAIKRHIATEQAFEVDIVNPATGARTPSYTRGGKMDGVVETMAGTTCLIEHKTGTGIDENYWKRLDLDPQITGYIDAGRQLGFAISSVLYNVVQKPTIRPCDVAEVDGDGVKVVVDGNGERVRTKDGKKWRETGDAQAGYVLLTRPMTVDEWAEKLRADVLAKPEWYFQRREIPRLESDLDEYRHELWQQQQDIREAERAGRHYRNTGACVGFGKCEYLDVCANGITRENPPAGFVAVDELHPELAGE